ncbi:MAG: ACT domain-containing protein [Lachnospiraceae bacterium]|nr:ACT domain-containing protein [Lachnospiraceae bacterium]MDD3617705.1 ACT domain-containing protein [Lachnospiraceae bacterium]
MFVKQLSVFIENRKGRLEQVTEVLREHNINIVSLSLADTNEYGLLRMIVSDPEAAKNCLKDEGYSAMLTNVIAVCLPHEVGVLQRMLKLLSDAELNVEYMYALTTRGDNGAMIIKTSNPEVAAQAILDGGMKLYTSEEAYTINE